MARTSAKLTGKRCQCSACGEYFSTISNFDRHRKGKHESGRFCVDPESAGLVMHENAGNTYWGQPGPDKNIARVV